MPQDPRTRSENGRLGGLTRSVKHDAREGTAHARRAFLSRFEREVDPDGVLPVEERLRRATAACKLHMARLYQKRAKQSAKSTVSADDEALDLLLDMVAELIASAWRAKQAAA